MLLSDDDRLFSYQPAYVRLKVLKDVSLQKVRRGPPGMGSGDR